MAEKAAEKKKRFSIKRIWSKIVRFFRDIIGEIKKIVWPTGKSVVKNTVVVIIMCLIVGAFIWLFDFVFGLGVDKLLSM